MAQQPLSRLVKTPKLHVGDTGLACALLGVDARALTADRELLGQLLETFVFQELRRQASWHEDPLSFFHFRDRDDFEVDIVIERGARELAGVEVKAAATVRAGDFRGLRKLKEAPDDASPAVSCSTTARPARASVTVCSPCQSGRCGKPRIERTPVAGSRSSAWILNKPAITYLPGPARGHGVVKASRSAAARSLTRASLADTRGRSEAESLARGRGRARRMTCVMARLMTPNRPVHWPR